MADQFHRKIELQSPDDLTYLIANIRRAADAEIEKALPRIHGQPEGGEDVGEGDMRVVVERLVEDYIQQTLASLLPNITINGLPPSPLLIQSQSTNPPAIKETIVFEPFNAKRDAHAKALMAQEDDLIEEISRLRREVPGKIITQQKNLYQETGQADEEVMKVLDEKVDTIEREGVVLSSEFDERRDQVRRTWEKGVAGLERVVDAGPGVVAKKERAAKAEEYVKGIGRI